MHTLFSLPPNVPSPPPPQSTSRAKLLTIILATSLHPPKFSSFSRRCRRVGRARARQCSRSRGRNRRGGNGTAEVRARKLVVGAEDEGLGEEVGDDECHGGVGGFTTSCRGDAWRDGDGGGDGDGFRGGACCTA